LFTIEFSRVVVARAVVTSFLAAAAVATTAVTASAAPNFIIWSLYAPTISDLNTSVESNFFPPGSSPTVYVASGVNYPDAIAAGPLLGREKSLMVLADEHGNTGASNGVRIVGATKIVIIGGTAAVHPRAESLFRDNGYRGATERIAGVDRYDTAAKVAVRAYPQADTVFLASGQNYPDALSAGPAASYAKAPVLLTDPTTLPARTATALAALGAKNVVVIGGEAAVSAVVLAELEGKGYAVRRVAGDNRYSTAVEVAKAFFPGPKMGYVAPGDSFTAALAASSPASKQEAPLLLKARSCAPSVMVDYLNAAPELTAVRGVSLTSSLVNPISPVC